MANYLVTGGGGFIGSNIVEHLVEHGEAVRVIDNFVTGRRENLEPFMGRIELVEGDLRDADTCLRAAEDMDFVLHQGGLNSVPRSIDNPVESVAANAVGTAQLLHACVQAKVKRLVFAGSSSVYGEQDSAVRVETQTPSPISPYAASKLAAEHLCRTFHLSFGIEVVCLRYFNVFGPRQNPHSPYSAVIPLFIKAILSGRRPMVLGDGLQSRDFTFVENVVRANILAARARKAAVGRVMNIACGKAYSLLDVIAAINEVTGSKIEPDFSPARKGDVKHAMANIALARELLGYEPGVDLKEGIRRTAEWYRSGKEKLT